MMKRLLAIALLAALVAGCDSDMTLGGPAGPFPRSSGQDNPAVASHEPKGSTEVIVPTDGN